MSSRYTSGLFWAQARIYGDHLVYDIFVLGQARPSAVVPPSTHDFNDVLTAAPAPAPPPAAVVDAAPVASQVPPAETGSVSAAAPAPTTKVAMLNAIGTVFGGGGEDALARAMQMVREWNDRVLAENRPGARQRLIDPDDLRDRGWLVAAEAPQTSEVDFVARHWSAGEARNPLSNAHFHFVKHATVLGRTFATVAQYVEAAVEAKRRAGFGYDQQGQGGKTHWVALVRATVNGPVSGWMGTLVVFDEGQGRIASFYELTDESAKSNGYASVPAQLYRLKNNADPTDLQLAELIQELLKVDWR